MCMIAWPRVSRFNLLPTAMVDKEIFHPYSKPSGTLPTTAEKSTVDPNTEDEKQLGIFQRVTQVLLQWGIETQGYVLVTWVEPSY